MSLAPPGLAPPGAPHDDAGPKLNAVTWTLCGGATLLLGLRLYCKRISHHSLWWDDWMLIAAWTVLLVDCILMSVQVSYGYGKHSYDIPLDVLTGPLIGLMLSRATLSIIASVWSKTSFALTLLRLVMGKLWWFLVGVMVSMNVIMGLHALFGFVYCSPVEKAWKPWVEGTCWPHEALWDYGIFAMSYSAAMDFMLAMLPLAILWHLRMQRAEKAGIVVAMSLGVFAGLAGVVKTFQWATLTSIDLYDAVNLNIWDIAEPSVTIMAASMPTLRVLIRDMRSAARGANSSSDRSRQSGAIGSRSSRARRPAADPDLVGLDSRSDKGIFDRTDGIYRTREVTVEHSNSSVDLREIEWQQLESRG